MARGIRLYVITRRVTDDISSHLEIVKAAVNGGADAVQIREKNASYDDLLKIAEEAKNICAGGGVKLIINDFAGLAAEAGADGVHLGEDDEDIAEARRLLGDGKLIGGSAGNVAEALAAVEKGADYIGVGPVFETKSKYNAGEPIGLDGLKKICEVSAVPVIAIGGITKESAAGVLECGAAGIAVVSAVSEADDKTEAVRELKEALNG